MAVDVTAVTASYVPDTVAATLIGSTAPTLRRWRHEGKHLRYYKVGSSVRYKVTDLEDFLAKHLVEADPSGRHS